EDPTGDLASILTYHVVAGEVLAPDVVGLDGQDVETVNGATFTVNVGDDGSVTLTDGAGNEVGVVQTDIATSNGVIHVLDGVLLPGGDPAAPGRGGVGPGAPCATQRPRVSTRGALPRRARPAGSPLGRRRRRTYHPAP